MPFALISLFLAAFSIGTTEFVVAGLLPAISADLGVSIPAAGLLISGYAVGVAIGGPILSLLTSRFPRKPMIISLMVIFVVGHVLCAIAPSYATLMAARIVVSFSHGTFFGLAAIIAISLVPDNKRGQALSIVFAGISVSNIIGVPLGTAIGTAFGWRAAFWAVGSLAVIAGLAMAFALPSRAAPRPEGARLVDQFRVLIRPQVYLTYLVIIVMMVGFFSFFSYIAPFLTEVSGVAEAVVPWMLLIFGVGATIGIFIGGRLGDWRPNPTLIIAFTAQVVVFALVLTFASNCAVMVALLFFIGFAGMMTNASLQNRVLRGASEAPDLASTLISSVFNIGIALGAYLGGVALAEGAGYANLPWIGIVTACLAVALVVFAIAVDKRLARNPAPAA